MKTTVLKIGYQNIIDYLKRDKKSSTKNNSKHYVCKHRIKFILLGSGACRVKTLLILPLVCEFQPLEHDAAYFDLGGFPWSCVVKPNDAISVG